MPNPGVIRNASAPIIYFVFDVIVLAGRDVRRDA
jgi:ATP-dependent DNA ligase